MIVKLTAPDIELVVDNLGSYIKHRHQLNLLGFQSGTDVAASDTEVVELLGLYYQLKNILLVENAKRDQVAQQIQYLKERCDMLFGFLAVSQDAELDSAIKSIQNNIKVLKKSMDVNEPIDINLAEHLHTLLIQKNIIN